MYGRGRSGHWNAPIEKHGAAQMEAVDSEEVGETKDTPRTDVAWWRIC